MPHDSLPKPANFNIETLNTDGTVQTSHYVGDDHAAADKAYQENPQAQAFHKIPAGGFHRQQSKPTPPSPQPKH